MCMKEGDGRVVRTVSVYWPSAMSTVDCERAGWLAASMGLGESIVSVDVCSSCYGGRYLLIDENRAVYCRSYKSSSI